MKKALPLLAAPLALAACSTLGLPNGDVTGSISGTAPAGGDVRLALLGRTGGGFENNAVDQVDVGTFNPQKRVYAISLPAAPRAGAYEVTAYVDSNGNKAYDAGEPRTTYQNRFLIYSNSDLGLFGFNVKQGWNRVEGSAVSQGRPFSGFDLRW
ncbi:hypothetical protein [Deinococcus hopiensis]|uniref:hypothetical protein n=1 Tax=Deinococcus hopiensis TaxID=309885 RepID=UPI000A01D595|nr:hypothetical protein [Deinococcus hopiensis]